MIALVETAPQTAAGSPPPPTAPSAGAAREHADLLFSTLYVELRSLARRQLARRSWRLPLGTTTLLHEAYLVISARECAVFEDQARFMGYAARVMRGLIIDHARRRLAHKRGGQQSIDPLHEDVADPGSDDATLTRVGGALDGLAATDPALAQLVDLKFFCGFSCAEIAVLRGTTERTVQRHWERARLYLHRAIAHAHHA